MNSCVSQPSPRELPEYWFGSFPWKSIFRVHAQLAKWAARADMVSQHFEQHSNRFRSEYRTMKHCVMQAFVGYWSRKAQCARTCSFQKLAIFVLNVQFALFELRQLAEFWAIILCPGSWSFSWKLKNWKSESSNVLFCLGLKNWKKIGEKIEKKLKKDWK